MMTQAQQSFALARSTPGPHTHQVRVQAKLLQRRDGRQRLEVGLAGLVARDSLQRPPDLMIARAGGGS